VERAGEAAVPARPRLDDGPVQVRRAGPLTTVQDLGRPGYAHLGVPSAGAVDPRSARLANRLVGNAEGAALLEVTLGGLELVFDEAAVVAVCGADAPLSVDGRPMGEDSAVPVPAGGVVTLGQARHGLRSYVAIRGGIDVRPVLGSRSTDTLAGLGPPPLADGDRLGVGSTADNGCDQAQYETAPTRPPTDELELRVVPGPRHDWLTEQGLHRLFTQTWTVTPTSDRTGLRLDGPALERSGDEQLLSEGMVAGALQVPPDGRPILFLANHPTTGGYPVVGVVVTDDLALAGQARPGATLRFRKVAPPAL
jgi:biotin-dependent carboxylase-like uncharacterized protein